MSMGRYAAATTDPDWSGAGQAVLLRSPRGATARVRHRVPLLHTACTASGVICSDVVLVGVGRR
jgi:hypothetical protein